MENTAVGFPFLWAFLSDRISYTRKDVNVQFFIHNSGSCQLCKRIPLNYTSKYRKHFEANIYLSFFHACYLSVFKRIA